MGLLEDIKRADTSGKTAYVPKPLRVDRRVSKVKQKQVEDASVAEAVKPKRKGIPKQHRFKVLADAKFKCVYCGAPGGSIRPDGSVVMLEADHKVSVNDGGGDEIENLCCACDRCNNGKRARSVRKPIERNPARYDNVVEKLQEIVGKKKTKQE